VAGGMGCHPGDESRGAGQSVAARRAGDVGTAGTPGWVETGMAAAYIAGAAGAELLAQHPLGRIARPEEIAQAAAFCALDAPAAMTGSIIDLNGASYLRT
jgi:3-oxoacyl-[acyl-carrier protein] reductase